MVALACAARDCGYPLGRAVGVALRGSGSWVVRAAAPARYWCSFFDAVAFSREHLVGLGVAIACNPRARVLRQQLLIVLARAASSRPLVRLRSGQQPLVVWRAAAPRGRRP